MIPASIVGHGAIRVIAVHGWLGGSELFAPAFPLIDTARYSCAFLDCRGYGERLLDAGPFTIEAIAEDVLAVADQLSWDRFHVMGHSMGGMVAQRLMVDAPGRIESAVLIAPVPASGAKIDERRRHLLLRAIVDPAARRELIDVNTGRVRDRQWLDAVLELSLRSTRREALEGYMAAWTGTDFAAEFAGGNVPSVVICGELDPGISPQLMRDTILRWSPAADLVVMSGVGHYPMREDPVEFWRVVSQRLQAATATSRRSSSPVATEPSC